MEPPILGEKSCGVLVEYTGPVLPKALLGSSLVCEWFDKLIDPKYYDKGSHNPSGCIWRNAHILLKDMTIIAEKITISAYSIYVHAFCETNTIEKKIIPKIVDVLKENSPYKDYLKNNPKYQTQYKTKTTKVHLAGPLRSFFNHDFIALVNKQVADRAEKVVKKNVQSFAFSDKKYRAEIHPYMLRVYINLYPETINDARGEREFGQIGLLVGAESFTDYVENLYTIESDLPFDDHQYILAEINNLAALTTP